MSFDTPFLLFLAPVIAIMAGAAAWLVRGRRIRFARRWSPSLAKAARARGGWAPFMIGLVTLLAMIALAGPRAGQMQVTTESKALSVVFAVDISRSMLAEDATPSRLQRALREMGRLVQDLEGDRLGLIAFAGRSYILSPLTVDGGAIRMYLDALDPEVASEGGSSLGTALSQGRELLGAATDAADRVLIVFTDGESHDTLPAMVAEAKALQETGIRLIVVAEGQTTPTRIPIRDSAGALLEYKQDEDGRIVQTARMDEVLHAVVNAAEGTLVPNELADQAGAVRELLTTMKRSPSAASRAVDLVPRAWISILVAALILIGYTLLRAGPALIGIGALVLGASAAFAQRPSTGERALAAGDLPGAARAYLEEASRGSGSDTAFYNAGTAALEAGRLDVARGALVKAAQSLDPELRYRALYNLGLVELRAAGADQSTREQHLTDAVEHWREALRLQPSSSRAKWNLELADRRRPPPPSGGGGGTPPPSGGKASQPPAPKPPEPRRGGLTPTQAEQILSSMERREQETRDEQRRRMPVGNRAGVKDW